MKIFALIGETTGFLYRSKNVDVELILNLIIRVVDTVPVHISYGEEIQMK